MSRKLSITTTTHPPPPPLHAYKMINQGKVAYSLVSFHVEMEAYKQQGCAQEFLSAGRSVLLLAWVRGLRGERQNSKILPMNRPTPLTFLSSTPVHPHHPLSLPHLPPQFIRLLSSSRQCYAKFDFFLG